MTPDKDSESKIRKEIDKNMDFLMSKPEILEEMKRHFPQEMDAFFTVIALISMESIFKDDQIIAYQRVLYKTQDRVQILVDRIQKQYGIEL